MSRLNDLKTGTKLVSAFLALALIIVGVAVLGYTNIRSVNAGMATMYADRLLPAQQLATVNDAQLTIQVDLYRFILVPEDRNTLEQDIVDEIKRADENMQLYEATYLVPDEVEGLAKFKPAWSDYQQAVAEVIRQTRAGNTVAALQSVADGGSVFTTQRVVDQVVTDLVDVQVRVGVDLKQQGDRTVEQATWTMTLAGLIGVLLAVVLGLVISRSIAGPLSKITGVARDVSEGNLDTAPLVELTSRDEIGILARTFSFTIDQLKQTLEGLRRLNRELRAISNCNQTLLRAGDEQSLLNNICRIVCDEAGYHMAWVGYAENDDAKTIRPVAWAGNEAGYLANTNITWAETEHGRGPTGIAIRSGESVCVQDFTNDPQAAPWRENALQRGYRSSLALPLKDESAKTFGALNIYSAEPNAFTLDEMRLLEELAGDLAFGITALRTRAERKQAEDALRESETKFRAVFENSVDAIGVSKVGIHTFVNPAYLALFGYADNAELTGKPILALIAPSHRAQILENVRGRASGQPGPVAYETRGLRKDGSEFDMDVHVSTYELNGEVYTVPIIRDITERKRNERELIILNRAINQSSDAVFLINEQLNFAYVNDAACRSLDYTREELLTMGPSDIDAVITYDAAENIMKKQFANGHYPGFETQHKTRTGRIFPVEISSSIVEYDGANFSLTTVRDITERKRAEQALRESEERLRQIASSLREVIWLRDAQTRQVLYVNPAFQELTGRTCESFYENRDVVIDAVHPDDKEGVTKALDQRSESAYYNKEHRIIHLDGSVHWVSSQSFPVQNEAGEVYRWATIMEDITEHKQAEEALRESEERFRSFVEKANDIVYTVSLDGVFTYVSPNWKEMLGHETSEVEGKSFEIFVHPDDLAACRAILNHVLVSGEKLSGFEYRVKHKDGSWQWHTSNASVIRDGDGRVISFLGIARNITERKQMDENLRQMNERFSLAARAAHLGVWDWDLQKDELVWDDGMYVLYGVKREDFAGAYEAWLKGIHPDDRAPSDEISKQAQRGEREYDTEFRVVWPDGSLHYLKAYGQFVRDADGKPLRMTGVNFDITERKRAEEALRESDAMFRGFFRQSTDGIAVVDEHACVAEWNQTLEVITGLKREHVIGRLMAEAQSEMMLPERRSPETLERIRMALQEMLQIGQSPIFKKTTDASIHRPDGTRRFIQQSSFPIPTEHGFRIGIITRDVTEHRLAEEALRASEERYHTLFAQAPDAIFLENEHDEILDVNPAACMLLGYSREELLGMRVSDLQAPERREQLGDIIKNELSRHGGAPFESVDLRKDGSRVAVEISDSRMGDSDLVLSIVRDITERKRNERELIILNRAINQSSDAVFLINEQLIFAYVNDAACHSLGYTREELLAMGPSDIDADITYESAKNIMNRQFADGYYERFETQHKTRAGRIFPVEISSSIVEYDGAKFSLTTVRNITERRQVEIEIRRLNQELEQRVADRTALLEAANKELEAFAYSVSHDLRAPLRHIDGFLELLQERTTTLDEKSQHYMATIADSARRMGVLIDDLLSFSRMGRNEMSKSQVDLGELVQEVIQELRPDTESRDIQWQISPLPSVAGDRAMLKIVLVNLISNALKFTRSRSQAKIEIGWMPGYETETIVFVRDNGVGFDMQYANKLFGVFQRLHRADEFEGTGIGLANVRRVINRHGGSTWAEGEVDRGATFYFSLPQSQKGDMK